MKARTLILFILGLLIVVGAPFFGALPLSSLLQNSDGIRDQVLWDIRVPRVAMAFLAGVGLSIAGLIFQGIFRNILATPYTLGVSSGAALGATMSFAIGGGAMMGAISRASIWGMAGALLVTILVLWISRSGGRKESSPVTLVLSGVVLSFLLSSVILFLQYVSDFAGVARITRWLMGSIERATMDGVAILFPCVALSSIIAWWYSYDLDLIAWGDEIAATRGVNVKRTEKILIFVTSISVGAIVSLCGPIGFVGIVVPHLGRMLFGAQHRSLIPKIVILGGSFLVLCDTVSRTVIAPYELPVGIVTALVGGPFFLWVLKRSAY